MTEREQLVQILLTMTEEQIDKLISLVLQEQPWQDEEAC